jgi:GNAT superfamily N-acetyltransferase
MNKLSAGALITYNKLVSYKREVLLNKQKSNNKQDDSIKNGVLNIKYRSYFTWLLKYNDTIIGYATIYKQLYNIVTAITFPAIIDSRISKILKARKYYSLRIVLAHNYQRKGIGTYVLGAITTLANKNNINIMSLIESTNEPGIAIHIKHSYNRIGTVTYRKRLYYVFMYISARKFNRIATQTAKSSSKQSSKQSSKLKSTRQSTRKSTRKSTPQSID